MKEGLKVTVTARELRYGIEAALATDRAARTDRNEAFNSVREGEEGSSASAAIILAAAAYLHLEGFSEEEIMGVFQKGLEELGVPIE